MRLSNSPPVQVSAGVNKVSSPRSDSRAHRGSAFLCYDSRAPPRLCFPCATRHLIDPSRQRRLSNSEVGKRAHPALNLVRVFPVDLRKLVLRHQASRDLDKESGCISPRSPYSRSDPTPLFTAETQGLITRLLSCPQRRASNLTCRP